MRSLAFLDLTPNPSVLTVADACNATGRCFARRQTRPHRETPPCRTHGAVCPVRRAAQPQRCHAGHAGNVGCDALDIFEHVHRANNRIMARRQRGGLVPRWHATAGARSVPPADRRCDRESPPTAVPARPAETRQSAPRGPTPPQGQRRFWSSAHRARASRTDQDGGWPRLTVPPRARAARRSRHQASEARSRSFAAEPTTSRSAAGSFLRVPTKRRAGSVSPPPASGADAAHRQVLDLQIVLDAVFRALAPQPR